MADIRVRLDGVEGLKKVLDQLPVSMRKKHLRRAIRQGIVLIRNDIKNTAPVRAQADLGYRKGKRRPKPGRLRRLVRIRPRRPKRGYLKVSLFYPTNEMGNDPKNAFYWRFVEFGTRHTSPNPYIARATQRNFGKVLSRVIAETNRGVREDLAKLRARTA